MMLAAAVGGGLFCTLQAKRCRRVQSTSLSVTAALAAIMAPPAMFPAVMVEPATLMAWWQISGRVVPTKLVYLAGQAAPGMQVVLRVTLCIMVEVAVALEDKGRQKVMKRLVTAARALNRPYLVPPIIMAAAAAAAPWGAITAMEDWVAVGQVGPTLMLLQVQPSQGVEVAAVDTCLTGGQAAPASSSSATRRKPPARRRRRHRRPEHRRHHHRLRRKRRRRRRRPATRSSPTSRTLR